MRTRPPCTAGGTDGQTPGACVRPEAASPEAGRGLAASARRGLTGCRACWGPGPTGAARPLEVGRPARPGRNVGSVLPDSLAFREKRLTLGFNTPLFKRWRRNPIRMSLGFFGGKKEAYRRRRPGVPVTPGGPLLRVGHLAARRSLRLSWAICKRPKDRPDEQFPSGGWDSGRWDLNEAFSSQPFVDAGFSVVSTECGDERRCHRGGRVRAYGNSPCRPRLLRKAETAPK